jgi:signal transduction histidine kinase
MYDASSRQVWDEDIRAQVMQRLSDLGDSITDLVVFAETKPPVMAPVSLPELVAEAVTLASTRPTCAHVAVRTDVPQTSVNVDREQLRRVLFNLIVNGAQAMQGQGEIAIRADVSRNRWQLEVIDNGPGISPAVRARLFEPFFSTKNHGVGLGLAFAKRVVQSHGGTIDFRFPPGGGAAAVLSLPT